MFMVRQSRSVLLLIATLSPASLLGQDAQPAPNPAPEAGLQPASLSAVLEKLAPESRVKLGEMLSTDWKERPEWADMLVGLLKNEKMTPTFGWFKPSEKKYDWNWLASKFDADADGVVSKDELPADTPNLDRFFSRFDRDNDGKLRASDFDYSGQSSTPPAMMTRFLSSVLDQDSNGRITREELEAFLNRVDKDQAGFITSEDLYGDFTRAYADLNSGDDMPGPERMLTMFFNGELGNFDVGPALGVEAPDFTLPTHDGSQTITLSKCRGKPAILIFGSFT
jgi:Ca2+-binding EF-hand superfamily protein